MNSTNSHMSYAFFAPSMEALASINVDRSTSWCSYNSDVNEIRFLVDMQVSIYLDAGDHDSATRCLDNAIYFINDIKTVETVVGFECAAVLESLLFLRAHVYSAATEPFKSISDLQQVLRTSKKRHVREEALGFLARVFLKLRDFERCREILASLERYRISLGRLSLLLLAHLASQGYRLFFRVAVSQVK